VGVLFKNADITIYNRYYNNITGMDNYQRTVIEGVNWQGKRTGTVSDKGLLLADSTLIFIDKLDNYVSPKRFKKLSDTERPNYFTFAENDRIVRGAVDFEITGMKGHMLKDLNENFDNVINVKSVADLPQHWEVEGV
jgi:hypothetical protein